MRAQVLRVGEAWEYLEKFVLPGTTYPKSSSGGSVEQFKARDLKQEWFDWMKETHKSRMEKLNKELEDKVRIFQKKSPVTPRLKRWDYSGLFGRAVNPYPNCGYENDNTKMDKRVELLLDAYKNLPKLDTELRLD